MKVWQIIVLVVLLFSPWFINAKNLIDCDFESPYKCEVVHEMGVFIPPLSYVTMWFDSDKK